MLRLLKINTKLMFYVCLFTCGVTCVVHLELVDLTGGSFLQLLCCFASRGGLPNKMISDNANTSAREVKKIMRATEV